MTLLDISRKMLQKLQKKNILKIILVFTCEKAGKNIMTK